MTIRSSSSSGIPFGESSGRPSSPALGQPYFNATQRRLELYTANGWQNIVSETPSVTGVTGSYLESNSTNTITIIGTSFSEGCVASAIGTNGVSVEADTTTVTSAIEISAVFSGLSASYEPYDIRVTNLSNLYGQINNNLYINSTPTWLTSAGNLATVSYGQPISLSVSATDIEGSSVTYSSSNMPAFLSLNTSTGAITGTGVKVSSSTTHSFAVTASDGANSVSRTFNVISSPSIYLQALLVAGGGGGGGWVGAGGGAGGIVYSTGTSVTLSSQKTIEVGAGGNRTSASTSGYVAGTNGGNSTFNNLVALGGGVGGTYSGTVYLAGVNGGSGGGGSEPTASGSEVGGTATQPSSASGGYGNNGGTSLVGGGGSGGGGAGAAGGASSNGNGGAGGAGLNTWSAWATATSSGASGYYAGGGGGGSDNSAGAGGAGGGGAGTKANDGQATSGTANTGGGGGGARNSGGPATNQGGAGGSGIVILRYPDTLDDPTQYSGTKYTSGGYKYFKFTTNGTITF